MKEACRCGEEGLVADDEVAIVEPREPERERVRVHDDGCESHEQRVVATRPGESPDQLQTALFALQLPPLLQVSAWV